MGHPQLQTVLRHAGALAGRTGAAPDSELLRRFADDRDDATFAELVRRHGPMVWGVCRNMLPHDADAEDAFQATFLALVRAAGSIRDADRLAGWLHGVAVRVALKARRASAHRRRREQAAAGGEASEPVPEAAWDELLAAVHEEVQRLPEALRTAFVLCGLEGIRQPEAAARLGCNPSTLTARLTRARQRLLEGLARRGIAPAIASGALAAGAATGTATAPAALVIRAAGLIQPMVPISPTVLYLAQGVIEMNARTKWLAAAVLAAVGVAMTAGTAIITPASAQRPDPDPQPPTRGDRGRDDRGDRGREPGRTPGAASGGFVAGPAVRGWEYKTMPRGLNTRDPEADLNKLGNDGWEMCGIDSHGTLVFKRPKGPTAGMFGGGGGGAGGSFGGFGGSGPGGPGGPGGGVRFGGPGPEGLGGGGIANLESMASAMFNRSDRNNDGKITRDETEGIARLADEFNNQDANKDGSLDRAEFRKFMETRLPGRTGGSLQNTTGGGASGSSTGGGMFPPGGARRGSEASGGGTADPVAREADRATETLVIKLKYSDAADLAAVLTQVFVQSPRTRIVAEQRTNSLLVSGDPNVTKAITALVERLDIADTRPRKQ